jgi:hypothetical protein
LHEEFSWGIVEAKYIIGYRKNLAWLFKVRMGQCKLSEGYFEKIYPDPRAPL